MQIRYPSPSIRDNGDYGVTLNPGNDHPFVIITLSEDRHTAMVVQSPEEARRLVKAAVEAEQLLAQQAAVAELAASIADGTPLLVTDDEPKAHVFTPMDSHGSVLCNCGEYREHGIHGDPEPASVAS